jgi:hypothetical protein
LEGLQKIFLEPGIFQTGEQITFNWFSIHTGPSTPSIALRTSPLRARQNAANKSIFAGDKAEVTPFGLKNSVFHVFSHQKMICSGAKSLTQGVISVKRTGL